MFLSAQNDTRPMTVPLEEPWRTLEIYNELPSTQDLAVSRLGAEEDLCGVVIQAHRQGAGHGRFDRQWISPEGGLYITACLPRLVPTPWDHIGWLPLAGALATAQWISKTYKLHAEIKWPNDVLVEERKVAGILGDVHPAGRALVGLGLNWSNPIDRDAQLHGFAAATLAEWDPKLCPERQIEFLEYWLDELDRWAEALLKYPADAPAELAGEAESMLWRRGRHVQLARTESGLAEGKLIGLGEGGSARVMLSSGQTRLCQCGWLVQQAAARDIGGF